ncbi:MAG TPA: endonuclease domain-containing protein [bacterium]
MKGKALKGLARSLRHHQTEAEKTLWKHLRSRQLQGMKFRRQQPFGPYIADFCSLENKLVVELDGGQHAEAQEKDAKRTKYLEQQGYRVIRIWDHEVFANVTAVLEYIQKSLEAPSPQPSPLEGEGAKRKKDLNRI